jgi:hypothetical protein
MTNVGSRRLAGAGLLVAAVGIVVQIAGGANYPVVPPGLIIVLVAAAITWFAPWRWAGFVALAAILFLCFGAIVAPNFRDQLGDPGQTVVFLGSLVQAAGLVAGLAGLVPAAVRGWRADRRVRPPA